MCAPKKGWAPTSLVRVYFINNSTGLFGEISLTSCDMVLIFCDAGISYEQYHSAPLMRSCQRAKTPRKSLLPLQKLMVPFASWWNYDKSLIQKMVKLIKEPTNMTRYDKWWWRTCEGLLQEINVSIPNSSFTWLLRKEPTRQPRGFNRPRSSAPRRNKRPRNSLPRCHNDCTQRPVGRTDGEVRTFCFHWDWGHVKDS